MIPNNLKYSSKVESANCRRYRTNIAPQGGQGTSTSGYGPGSTITINIPTRNNTALIPSESVLKFSYNATLAATTSVACLDSCGAHAFIQRVRVFCGSNLLSDIDQYSGLAKILMDYQAPLDTTQGRFSATSGTTNDYASSTPAYTSVAEINANGVIVKPVNRGKNYIDQSASTTPTLASGFVLTDSFSINLLSIVGALAGSKYLPLWEMTSAPLRVEIVLQPSIVNVMCISPTGAVPTTFNVFGVEYIGEFLELPDALINTINSNSSNPLQMVVSDYRNYQFSTTLQNAVTTLSIAVPAKFSSLKSIVAQTKVTNGAHSQYPTGSQNFNLAQYNWRIGSEVLPSTAPNNVPDFFTEACKCFGSIADLDYQPSIDISAYNVQYNAGSIDSYAKGVASNSGAFLIGIDCETYQNTDKSSIFSGMNTNTSDIFLQTTHNATSANLPINYNMYANFDSVLVFENGVCYARF